MGRTAPLLTFPINQEAVYMGMFLREATGTHKGRRGEGKLPATQGSRQW